MSGALREALAAQAPEFNRKVQHAQRSHPSLETAVLERMLKEGLEPLVDAVEAVSPPHIRVAVSEGFDLALDLAALGLGRSGFAPNAARWWRILAGQATSLLPSFRAELAALTNALLFLRTLEGVSAEAWLDRLERLPPQGPALRDAVLVTTWACGAAPWRMQALRAARALTAESFQACTGLTGFPACLDALAANPWWDPAGPSAPRIAGWLGDFAGNDGPFAEPPTVAAEGGRLIVSGGKVPYELHADRFGMMLVPASGGSSGDPAAPMRCAWKGNLLDTPAGPVDVAFPERGRKAVGVGGVVAAHSPFSFRIAVVSQ